MESGEVSFSRGREAEKSIRELAGEEYAQKFWKQFRANYITKKDIEKMANLAIILFEFRLIGDCLWKRDWRNHLEG